MKNDALRILIVEDEPLIAESIAQALEQRGHAAEVALSLEEALLCDEPDVLVSDLDLGERSGLDLLEELQERGDCPRTIFITGLPTLEDCRRAMRLGAAEFLAKPFDFDELFHAVEDETPGHPVVRKSRGCFEATYTASPVAVDQAARDLAAYALRCGLGPASRCRVSTATAEVIDNAWRHAYPAGPGLVRVHAEIDERSLFVRVEDRGVGFDVLTQGLDRVTSQSDSGLARATKLSEDIRIWSQPDLGTRVELDFAAYRVHFDDDCTVDLSELDFMTPQTTARVITALNDTGDDFFHLSPALAVTVGRLLAGPDPRRALKSALRNQA